MQVGSYFQAMKAANERIQELEKAAFEICQCIDRDQAPASYDRLLALCEPRASSQAASDTRMEMCDGAGGYPVTRSLPQAGEGVERAWREGWSLCKASLTEDEAFCLTDDVEADAWADSEARAAIAALNTSASPRGG